MARWTPATKVTTKEGFLLKRLGRTKNPFAFYAPSAAAIGVRGHSPVGHEDDAVFKILQGQHEEVLELVGATLSDDLRTQPHPRAGEDQIGGLS